MLVHKLLYVRHLEMDEALCDGHARAGTDIDRL